MPNGDARSGIIIITARERARGTSSRKMDQGVRSDRRSEDFRARESLDPDLVIGEYWIGNAWVSFFSSRC